MIFRAQTETCTSRSRGFRRRGIDTLRSAALAQGQSPKFILKSEPQLIPLGVSKKLFLWRRTVDPHELNCERYESIKDAIADLKKHRPDEFKPVLRETDALKKTKGRFLERESQTAQMVEELARLTPKTALTGDDEGPVIDVGRVFDGDEPWQVR